MLQNCKIMNSESQTKMGTQLGAQISSAITTRSLTRVVVSIPKRMFTEATSQAPSTEILQRRPARARNDRKDSGGN